ncbi:hypothetical protein C2G38_2056057 [Gigaspora rosea]|uniref:Uncharacterized protein n=1 Tax=Gigaspora rosea TaxID=44941 RepID=A0A397W4M7_9GLOM|nr:hypothetical protein C2G38_2056057 [Gigaspora rosea]
MRAWNRFLYGDLKYILAYAAGGSYLQFYAIDPSFNLHIISDILDLCYLKDRVKALICIFNIHRIIRSMESLLPETAVPILTRFKRPYGDIFITDTVIEKRIFSFSTYPFSNITVLTNIYQNTKNNRNIIHAVGYPQIVNNTYKVKLAPLIDNSWMLIDLECAGIDDEIVDFGPSEDWAPEVIETKKKVT